MKSKITSSLNELFEKWSGVSPSTFEQLPETTSGRKYFRLQAGDISAIGVYNNNKRENNAFIYLSRHLRKHNINVPLIYEVDDDNNTYLIEDLGDTTLNKYLQESKDQESYNKVAGDMYKKIIDEMPEIQVSASRDLDFGNCYPRPEFDYQSIMWDLNYFKYYFLKMADIGFDEQFLEKDFKVFTDYLLKADCNYFLYRDLQSRNIIIQNDNIYFIDYQGGRKGALQYDLASLLFEAKAQLSNELRQELLDYYITVNSEHRNFNSKEFTRYYPAYVLVRMIQAMGAYGFRGYFERKVFYLQSIPYAVKNLEWLLSNYNLSVKIPELSGCLNQIVNSEYFNEYEDIQSEFVISINSFSYNSGIPQDNSGNGGGFVFDCRAVPNPGRHKRYRQFTGKDKPVIDFLEKEKEVKNFADNAYSIIKASILNYQFRNFTNLMVNFGCTGGRHRSVYFAEQIAKRVRQNFNIKVKLRHRALEKSI